MTTLPALDGEGYLIEPLHWPEEVALALAREGITFDSQRRSGQGRDLGPRAVGEGSRRRRRAASGSGWW